MEQSSLALILSTVGVVISGLFAYLKSRDEKMFSAKIVNLEASHKALDEKYRILQEDATKCHATNAILLEKISTQGSRIEEMVRDIGVVRRNEVKRITAEEERKAAESGRKEAEVGRAAVVDQVKVVVGAVDEVKTVATLVEEVKAVAAIATEIKSGVKINPKLPGE